jgi:addiction module HigA family antidote
MATKSNRLVPIKAIHPGEILREELEARGIRQKDFAKAINVSASHLNEFINGKRNLNEDLAIKLELGLNISYKTWMELHNGYIYECKVISERTKVGTISKLDVNIEQQSLAIAETLKNERIRAGLTQEQLDEKIGLNKGDISKIETGKSDVQLSTLFRIFNGLGRRVRFSIL